METTFSPKFEIGDKVIYLNNVYIITDISFSISKNIRYSISSLFEKGSEFTTEENSLTLLEKKNENKHIVYSLDVYTGTKLFSNYITPEYNFIIIQNNTLIEVPINQFNENLHYHNVQVATKSQRDFYFNEINRQKSFTPNKETGLWEQVKEDKQEIADNIFYTYKENGIKFVVYKQENITFVTTIVPIKQYHLREAKIINDFSLLEEETAYLSSHEEADTSISIIKEQLGYSFIGSNGFINLLPEDIAIVWNNNKTTASIEVIKEITMDPVYPFKTNSSLLYRHAIKFESIEQYKEILNSK